MNNTELFKKPIGIITAKLFKGNPRFVKIGENEKNGFFILDNAEIIDSKNVKNLIVDEGSVLVARRMLPVNLNNGITHLEVGTGFGSGTLQEPEVENGSLISLRQPLQRKAISSWSFLDVAGNPTEEETNTIELYTIFDEQEAVGTLVEMGLFGGDATAALGSGYMYNYKSFPVWNKGSDMKLSVSWKLMF